MKKKGHVIYVWAALAITALLCMAKPVQVQAQQTGEAGETIETEQPEEYWGRDTFGYNVYFPVVEEPVLGVSDETSWQEVVKQRLLEAACTYQAGFGIADLAEYGYDRVNDGSELWSLLRQTIIGELDCFYIAGCSRTLYEVTFSYEDKYVKNDVLDVDAVSEDRALIFEAVDNALSGISDDMPELAKALYLHEWIVEQTDYAYEEYNAGNIPASCYGAAGVLINHKAVCSGYSDAYGLLLSKVGVESYVVSSSELNHAWNLVKIDGDWYHVDCTWDDPVWDISSTGDYLREGYVRHENFLRTDAGIIATGHCVEEHEAQVDEGHRCWTTTGLPKTAETEKYSNYVFRQEALEKAMYYHNGSWLYGSGQYIYTVSLDGNSTETTDTGARCVNMHVANGRIYYASPYALYTAELDNMGTLTMLKDYSSEFTIREFAVKGRNLILNGFNSAGEYKSDSMDMLENFQPVRIELGSGLAKSMYEIGEELDISGLIIYAYTDAGFKTVIDNSQCTFAGFSSDKYGTCKVTVTYKGLTADFDVVIAHTLTDNEVSVNDTYYYTGQQICPAPVVTVGGTTLTEGTDYTVTYGSNVNAGTGSVTVTGKGNYKGTIEKKITINSYPVKEDEVTIKLTGDCWSGYDSPNAYIKSNVSVRLNGKLLKVEEDYSFSKIITNIKGEYLTKVVVTVYFNGNYSGTYTCDLSPAALVISKNELNMTVGDQETLTVGYKDSTEKPEGVVFASSNTEVITVDQTGKVTAVGTGVAWVTASKGGRETYCRILVTEAEDESKPSEDESKPAEDESKPSEDESKPSESESKPSEGESNTPGDTTGGGSGNTGEDSENTGDNKPYGSYTGLVYDGSWWCVSDGQIMSDYTGLWYDETVGWWYVEKGSINFDYNGLIFYADAWWCVAKGQVIFDYTGLWYDPYVGWWYVEKGTINFGYNGLIPYADCWWCVAKGQVIFDYTGLWNDPYVGWWYVEKGIINFGYTGLILYADNWWCVADGRVIFDYSGWWSDPYVGIWYVENGVVNFAYGAR